MGTRYGRSPIAVRRVCEANTPVRPGFLQYIAPTLQLLVGVSVFDESITSAELFGFIAAWVALALFTLDRRRAADGSREPKFV